MSRQRSIVHLSGQFDDMQLSIDGKKGHAKLVVPLSKDKILTSPEFEGTRKVMAEFKGASLAVDSLQACLGDMGYTFGDRYLRSRLQRKLNAMLRRGPGEAGEKLLEVVPNAVLLKGLPLDKKMTFKSRFRSRYTITVNPDRNTATFNVQSFAVLTKLNVPLGSTHFRVFLCVGALSNFQYVGGDTVYEAVNPDINGENEIVYSPYLLAKGTVSAFQIVASLPTLPVLPTSAGLVVSLGIEFYSFAGTTYSAKAMGNALDIVAVY